VSKLQIHFIIFIYFHYISLYYNNSLITTVMFL